MGGCFAAGKGFRAAPRGIAGHYMRRSGGLLRRVGFIAAEAAVALGFIVTVAAIAKYGL